MVVTIKLKKCQGSTGSTERSCNTKRISPSKHWCFTLNNYNSSDITDILETVRKNGSNKYVFQEEKGENGTPHLQGYIGFSKKIRPKKLFTTRIHWEKCRNIKASIAYCSKEDTRVGKIYTNIKLPKKLKLITQDMLYDWQKKLINIIGEEPDDRKIFWYWSKEGCKGKTQFCKYLVHYHDALLIHKDAKSAYYIIAENIAKNHGYTPELIICNFPRHTDMERIRYDLLENIKDGLFVSSKYECKPVIMNPPHLIIFANDIPSEEDVMSKDRWIIINID